MKSKLSTDRHILISLLKILRWHRVQISAHEKILSLKLGLVIDLLSLDRDFQDELVYQQNTRKSADRILGAALEAALEKIQHKRYREALKDIEDPAALNDVLVFLLTQSDSSAN